MIKFPKNKKKRLVWTSPSGCITVLVEFVGARELGNWDSEGVLGRSDGILVFILLILILFILF